MNGLKKVLVLVKGYTLILEDGKNMDGNKFEALLTQDGFNVLIPVFSSFYFIPISYIEILEEDKPEVKDIGSSQSLLASIGAIPKNLTINF